MITMLETQLLDELKESAGTSQGRLLRKLLFYIASVYLDPHVVVAAIVSCGTAAVSASAQGSSPELLIPVCRSIVISTKEVHK